MKCVRKKFGEPENCFPKARETAFVKEAKKVEQMLRYESMRTSEIDKVAKTRAKKQLPECGKWLAETIFIG